MPLRNAGSDWTAGLLASGAVAIRRPTGDQGVGVTPRSASAAAALPRFRDQRVHPQVERGALRERGPFRAPVRPKDAREVRIEPLGIIALHVRGRLRQRALERTQFGLAQRRWRKARAVEKTRNRRGVEPALQMQHADHAGARACVAHQEGGRRLAAQRVVHQPGQRRAITGAGEAMRQSPVLERIGRPADGAPRYRPECRCSR
jgi:hypothetical protein